MRKFKRYREDVAGVNDDHLQLATFYGETIYGFDLSSKTSVLFENTINSQKLCLISILRTQGLQPNINLP